MATAVQSQFTFQNQACSLQPEDWAMLMPSQRLSCFRGASPLRLQEADNVGAASFNLGVRAFSEQVEAIGRLMSVLSGLAFCHEHPEEPGKIFLTNPAYQGSGIETVTLLDGRKPVRPQLGDLFAVGFRDRAFRFYDQNRKPLQFWTAKGVVKRIIFPTDTKIGFPTTISLAYASLASAILRVRLTEREMNGEEWLFELQRASSSTHTPVHSR